jgi:cbb3-type cytochrome oxidase subunit 1
MMTKTILKEDDSSREKMMGPTNIASRMAPPFGMVIKYFVASILSFVILAGMLVVFGDAVQGHHFQPKLLAFTHIATLGWITMIIFGAMFQLVPVVLEVKLFSHRLGEIQFWMYLVGSIGLVVGFWTFNVGIHMTASALLVTGAMLLFIGNILATMAKVSQWNLTGLYLLAALVYLAATAVAGLLLTINLGYPFISRIHLDYLKIHAHIGFIGWVVMVIMGVGLKLIPMFSLSHGYSMLPAKIAFVLVNIGLMGVSIEWLLTGERWLLGTYVAILVAGLLSFLVQLGLVISHRMRRLFDLGMKFSIVAFAYFFASICFGAILAFGDVEEGELKDALVLTYGAMIMLGFFSTLIIGQMYKIVPFLVWFHTFSDRVGKEQVPMLKDMVNERLGEIQFYLFTVGVFGVLLSLIFSQGTMLQISFDLVFVSSLLFLFNMSSIFYLKVRYGNKKASA